MISLGKGQIQSSGGGVDKSNLIYLVYPTSTTNKKIVCKNILTGIDVYSIDWTHPSSTSVNRNHVAVDDFGNLFILDIDAGAIYKVSPTGSMSTVIGSGMANGILLYVPDKLIILATSSRVIRQINKDTGAILSTYSLTTNSDYTTLVYLCGINVDRTKLYLTGRNSGAGTVTTGCYDIASNTEARVSTYGFYPSYVILSNNYMVTSHSSGALYYLDLISGLNPTTFYTAPNGNTLVEIDSYDRLTHYSSTADAAGTSFILAKALLNASPTVITVSRNGTTTTPQDVIDLKDFVILSEYPKADGTVYLEKVTKSPFQHASTITISMLAGVSNYAITRHARR